MYSFFLLQDSIFTIKEESEECKNFDEHVDIKYEINPTSQLVTTIKTSSEVRQGYECCKFNQYVYIFKILKTEKLVILLHSVQYNFFSSFLIQF